MRDWMESEGLLKKALLGNACFSGFSAAILLLGFGPLSGLLGISALNLLAVGVSLALFAAGLVRNALRERIRRGEAWLAAILDAAWVLGSAVLLAGPPPSLTATGWWAVAVVADIVAVFAAVQFYALSRRPETA